MSPRTAAFALAIALTPLAGAAASSVATSGPMQARASIDLRIAVPRVLELKLQHPDTVQVTAADAASGEVTVSGARVELVANGRRGYWLTGRVSGPFLQATIEGLDNAVTFDASGARVLMPSMVGLPRPPPRSVRYRLRLREGTPPGRYPWPVALSLESP